jgi:hypothetical protein
MVRRVTGGAHFRLCRILTTLLCLGVVLAGCNGKKGSQEKPIAQAFAGPVVLNLRQEISPASKTIATARHGETLDVLQVRRRFVRVRTPRGDQGWTDSRNLLTAEQMNAIADLAKNAKSMPSQGEATVFSSLNVHTDPNRYSTSFFQITESSRVDVLAHELAPRASAPPPGSFQVVKPKPQVRAKKPRKEPAIPPPPKPPPPGLPPNWIELSKTNLPVEEPPPVVELPESTKRKKPDPPKVPMEDWLLVRTKDGKAGWVVARMLNMAIPDEVAQYSEGARITSYFALADVYDDGQKKHHWLWTTVRDNQRPYQFDSFRVFAYVTRRHRYETSYIERNVEGYYPVEAKAGKTPTFSLILREKDGNLYRKTYVMEGYLVRKVADVPYSKPQEPGSHVISTLPPPPDDKGDEDETKPSLAERVKNFFKRTNN